MSWEGLKCIPKEGTPLSEVPCNRLGAAAGSYSFRALLPAELSRELRPDPCTLMPGEWPVAVFCLPPPQGQTKLCLGAEREGAPAGASLAAALWRVLLELRGTSMGGGGPGYTFQNVPTTILPALESKDRRILSCPVTTPASGGYVSHMSPQWD